MTFWIGLVIGLITTPVVWIIFNWFDFRFPNKKFPW